ncbi:putative vacuolar assembly protein vps41 [Leishmania major strain Friedlin]|uniref:Putative vacuolar assembly protein vps41 n=1 Tax=Leishmania major TaxID=5664 RepID=Q4Q7H5_LEIMA|nr:putative vacuolar assembly protein vps41 [Leishmania major strain Friedlin]CAG9578325.1 vacuolar_assembly_protein_vps41_-_putative [Leishmania major strain Friedlin]CAJ06196.1 putative vacuolar assembly protein vps41 [Leishmania major strain Friedlin]|eukprot:XP_001684723.1 putative vacuolar assembly protein vps41 [Leishmania major strain Friedlin]
MKRHDSAGDASASPSPLAPLPAPVQEADHAHDGSRTSSSSSTPASHHTLEKRETASCGRTRHSFPGGGENAGDDGVDGTENDSYTSYYEYDSSYDEENSNFVHSDKCRGSDSVDDDRFSTAASLLPQEDLLRFLSYTLAGAALKDHRLMAMEAFRHILVLGTNQGTVAVVEPSSGKLKEVYTNHHEPICDVDCTINELYIAACDKAGYVTIQSRRDVKDVWMAELSGPIESVALHPLYHKMDSCPMVCGGATKVLLLTKGVLWSNSRRVTTLQEGRGRIHKVRWCHTAAVDVVAWLSDAEITLYNMKSGAVARRVSLPGLPAQNALYPPTLRWEHNLSRDPTAAATSAATLLCGWGDVVQEVQLHADPHVRRLSGGGLFSVDRSPRSTLLQGGWRGTSSSPFPLRASFGSAAPASSPSPTTVAEAAGRAPCVVELRTSQPLRPSTTLFPYRVCGIAPYGPQRYVVLAGIVEGGTEGVLKDLEVRVVDRDSLTDVYRGRMPIRFIHPLQLRLTYLEFLPSLAAKPAPAASLPQLALPTDPLAPSPMMQYFILSVDTIVKAVPSDIDDHVEFLLCTSQFECAYRYAAAHARQLRRHVLEHVGQQWLMHLFHNRSTEEGALLKIVELLPELIPRDNSAAWEQWIYRLDTCGESWRLIALLPASTGASAEYKVTSTQDMQEEQDAYAEHADAAARSLPRPVATLQTPIQREYYDLVLLRCLRHDPSLFFAALHKFYTLFSVPVVLKATEVVYREQCAAAAWWEGDSSDEEKNDNDDKHVQTRDVTASNASPTLNTASADQSGVPPGAPASPPPTTPQGTSEETSAPRAASDPSQLTTAGAGAASAPSMSRTSRWSLVASYGFLLRCARRHEEALQVLLHLPASPRSDREVFGLIRDQQLFHKARELLPELLHRREDATLQLLMEHVAEATGRNGVTDGGDAALVSQVVAAEADGTAPSSPSLDALQYGSAQDPLCTESVISCLEKSDRLHLLRYLNLVQRRYPEVFAQAAKRHAQLVATLYIDYDRPSLLPFLKQMSMYVERIRELHALCHKHHFLEEEIFLLFRMGREDEALRILLERMHDLRRALKFVVTVPDLEEQAALFTRLVDYTVAYNASLPTGSLDSANTATGGAGARMRYVMHHTKPNETYASIAEQYHVALEDVCKANGVAGASGSAVSPPLSAAVEASKRCTSCSSPLQGQGEAQRRASCDADASKDLPAPPPQCVVPLNLFGDLLRILAEPPFMEHPALDVRLVLPKLPSREPILHAGPSIAAIAHAMAEEIAFFSTVCKVGENDLMGYYGQLLKRRTAAIAMGRPRHPAESGTTAINEAATTPRHAAAELAEGSSVVHRCAACRQLLAQRVVVFACQHMYHPACVLQYLRKSPTDAFTGGGGAAFGGRAGGAVPVMRDGAALALPVTSTAAAGAETMEAQLRKLPVYCRACRQHSGEQS